MWIEDSTCEGPGKNWSHDLLKCSRLSIACFTVDLTSSVCPQFSTIVTGLTIYIYIYIAHWQFSIHLKVNFSLAKFELLLHLGMILLPKLKKDDHRNKGSIIYVKESK